MKFSYFLLTSILYLISFDLGCVYALTPLETKGVKTIPSANVDTNPPSWTRTLNTTDLRAWLEILPNEESRSYDEYVIMPDLGIISPLVYTPTTDPRYKDIVEGRNLDVNEFLKQGVHHYPGTSLPGFEGNALIGGHSNFFKNQKTDFTSIFATLPMLDSGDVIWYYKRLTPESWMRYVYVVTKSYETKPEDTAVFEPLGTGSELTFYTCVPIGTADNRRIVRAELQTSQQVFYPQMIESYSNFSGYQDLDPETQERLRALLASGASQDEINQLLNSGTQSQGEVSSGVQVAQTNAVIVDNNRPWRKSLWDRIRNLFV